MKRTSLPVFLLLTLIAVPACAGRPATSTATPAKAVITMPFELVSRHILLKATVNGHPLWFCLDTGDKDALIDIDRARELGLTLGDPIQLRGASAAVSGAFIKGTSYSLDGLAGFSQPVEIALPLKNLAAAAGHDIDGVIGKDFIERFVVEVDYEAKVLRLHDRDKFVYRGNGESVPVRFNMSGHPVFEAEVTGVGGAAVKVDFVLDIGSSTALQINSAFAAEHGMPGRDVKTIRLMGAAGAGGAVTGRIGRVASFRLARFVIDRPVTLFTDATGMTAGMHGGREEAGTIGQRLASKFRIFLDYSHGRIIFEPAAQIHEPFDGIFTGMAVCTLNDYHTFRVTDVLENSPASTAGVTIGDVIVGVDGHPVGELTLTRLNEILVQTTSHKLRVSRGEQTLELTLTPRPLV
jgi:predicted aspartyl protease